MRRISASMMVVPLVAGLSLWAAFAALRVDEGKPPSGTSVPGAAKEAYTETKTIPVEADDLRALAVDAGARIYVGCGNEVRLLGETGRVRSKATLGGRLSCLTIAASGRVVAVAGERVELLEGDLRPLASWGDLGDGLRVTSVAAGDGGVFLADCGNRIVWRFDLQGRLLGQIGKSDILSGRPGFVVPSPFFDLALDGTGFLWVANPGLQQVERWTSDGRFIRAWGQAGMGTAGFCGCCNPAHLALLPDGSLVTSEKGIPRVKVYGPEGRFICLVAGPDRFMPGTEGLDLAADAEGRIYVLDPRARAVRIFSRNPAGPAGGTS